MIAIFTNDELFKFAVANMREHAINTLAEKMHMDVLRPEDGLPDHKKSGYAESLYEQADMIRKQKREEAFSDDAKIEGRRLNHEAHVDDRREANEAWDRTQEP